MQPSDLARVVSVSRPAVHPDGVRVAFQVSRIDLEGDTYQTSIWLWEGDVAEAPRRLTAGDRDSAPSWSPDGSTLAFLRRGDADDDTPQLAVLPMAGGEAQLITDFALGAGEFEWSPNGEALLVIGTVWTEDWAELEEDERARKPRIIDAYGYRFDNRGWIHDRRSYVHVVDAGGHDEPKRIGKADESEAGAAWSPDGGRVALLTTLDDPLRMRPGVEVVEIDVASGSQEVRARGTGYVRLVYHPDGALHAIGNATPDYPDLTSLWRLDEDGVHDLTGHTDRSVFSFLLPPDMAIPHWDDAAFLIGRVDGGRVALVRFAGDGSMEEVIGGDRYVTGFGVRADGSIVFAATDPTDPGELYLRLPDGEERRLTSFNDPLRADADLVEPRHLRVTSVPGVEVDTWLYVPPGEGPFPVLLNIHGGPASQYGFNFFDEFQVYAGAGYAVVACNPRGSAGRGRAWLKAVTAEGWGVVDVEDITAVVEHVLAADPRLDGDRLGIMGGSYGGFLTAWTIARDHRFRSAAVERALLGWESFSGTSDIARDFSHRYLGLVAPGDHEGMRAASPLDRAAEIRTPTLILHSENDFRCPIEQAEQLFMTLLRNEVDVRFVRFPGEGHELSRSGAPRHRVERFDIILDWHGRHLGAAAPS